MADPKGFSVDLVGAIDKLAELGKADTEPIGQMQVLDRHYIIDQRKGGHMEVLPRHEDIDPRAADVVLYDIDALGAWAQSFAPVRDAEQKSIANAALSGDTTPALLPSGQVIVSAAGGVSAHWPAFEVPYRKRTLGTVARLSIYDPPKGYCGVVDFLEWLDLIRPFLDEKTIDVLDLALRSVTASEGTVTRVEQNGAMIKVMAEAKGGAETPAPLPKRFTANMPFGDPTIFVEATFSLSVIVDKGIPRVKAVMIPEPARSQWVTQARAKLAAVLPPDWSVLVGP